MVIFKILMIVIKCYNAQAWIHYILYGHAGKYGDIQFCGTFSKYSKVGVHRTAEIAPTCENSLSVDKQAIGSEPMIWRSRNWRYQTQCTQESTMLHANRVLFFYNIVQTEHICHSLKWPIDHWVSAPPRNAGPVNQIDCWSSWAGHPRDVLFWRYMFPFSICCLILNNGYSVYNKCRLCNRVLSQPMEDNLRIRLEMCAVRLAYEYVLKFRLTLIEETSTSWLKLPKIYPLQNIHWYFRSTWISKLVSLTMCCDVMKRRSLNSFSCNVDQREANHSMNARTMYTTRNLVFTLLSLKTQLLGM